MSIQKRILERFNKINERDIYNYQDDDIQKATMDKFYSLLQDLGFYYINSTGYGFGKLGNYGSYIKVNPTGVSFNNDFMNKRSFSIMIGNSSDYREERDTFAKLVNVFSESRFFNSAPAEDKNLQFKPYYISASYYFVDIVNYIDDLKQVLTELINVVKNK